MSSEKGDIVFEITDDPEVVRFTHLQNGASWSTEFLTREEYADRERLLGMSQLGQLNKSREHMEQYKHSQHLGIKYFVLKDLSLPATSKTSQIVGSCETMNRTGWTLIPGSDEIHTVLSSCIGGVFTMKRHRGKGYARFMMNELNKYYDSIACGSEDPFLKYMILHLYSEVGEYYQKSGYLSYHVPLNEVFNLAELQSKYCDRASGSALTGEIRTLGYDDYEDLVEVERQEFKKQMLEAHAGDDRKKFKFTVEPSMQNLTWFEDRDIFVSKKFVQSPATKFGAALKDGSHIVWHHSWTAHSLILVKVQILGNDVEDKLSRLLTEAIAECHSQNLTHIEFWEDELPATKFPKLHETLSFIETGNNLKKINGSLSAIRLSPNYRDERCVWLNNTKFCWF